MSREYFRGGSGGAVPGRSVKSRSGKANRVNMSPLLCSGGGRYTTNYPAGIKEVKPLGMNSTRWSIVIPVIK